MWFAHAALFLAAWEVRHGKKYEAAQFCFTSAPNADFTVLASTNLNQWNILGPAAHNPPGQYQFTDPDQANHPRRFYKVASP